jgi:hypothetical protein
MQILQHFAVAGTAPAYNLRKTAAWPVKMMQLYGKGGMAATE